ncbi:hypothetical protein OH77DRAFT_176685 [Trametes cingulata]|nr:hypothetical protein OH77DRAFT_176685 [Trametes cingulata]
MQVTFMRRGELRPTLSSRSGCLMLTIGCLFTFATTKVEQTYALSLSSSCPTSRVPYSNALVFFWAQSRLRADFKAVYELISSLNVPLADSLGCPDLEDDSQAGRSAVNRPVRGHQS